MMEDSLDYELISMGLCLSLKLCILIFLLVIVKDIESSGLVLTLLSLLLFRDLLGLVTSECSFLNFL